MAGILLSQLCRIFTYKITYGDLHDPTSYKAFNVFVNAVEPAGESAKWAPSSQCLGVGVCGN